MVSVNAMVMCNEVHVICVGAENIVYILSGKREMCHKLLGGMSCWYLMI